MADIIDLRKINKRAVKTEPENERAPIAEEPRRIAPSMEKTRNALVSWSAYEYEKRERSTGWYVGAGIIASALVALGILSQNYFFIAFVALAFVMLVVYTKRPPRELEIEIFPEGIRAGKRLYEFSQIVSFWIFEKPDFKDLSLETKQTLQPYLRLPLGDADPEEIRKILSARIPEKEHADTFIDQLARVLGF